METGFFLYAECQEERAESPVLAPSSYPGHAQKGLRPPSIFTNLPFPIQSLLSDYLSNGLCRQKGKYQTLVRPH